MLSIALRDGIEMVRNDSGRQTRQAGNIILELWKIKSPQKDRE